MKIILSHRLDTVNNALIFEGKFSDGTMLFQAYSTGLGFTVIYGAYDCGEIGKMWESYNGKDSLRAELSDWLFKIQQSWKTAQALDKML